MTATWVDPPAPPLLQMPAPAAPQATVTNAAGTTIVAHAGPRRSDTKMPRGGIPAPDVGGNMPQHSDPQPDPVPPPAPPAPVEPVPQDVPVVPVPNVRDQLNTLLLSLLQPHTWIIIVAIIGVVVNYLTTHAHGELTGEIVVALGLAEAIIQGVLGATGNSVAAQKAQARRTNQAARMGVRR